MLRKMKLYSIDFFLHSNQTSIMIIMIISLFGVDFMWIYRIECITESFRQKPSSVKIELKKLWIFLVFPIAFECNSPNDWCNIFHGLVNGNVGELIIFRLLGLKELFFFDKYDEVFANDFCWKKKKKFLEKCIKFKLQIKSNHTQGRICFYWPNFYGLR